MAFQTGSSNINGLILDKIVIPAVNMRFCNTSSTYIGKDSGNSRQREIAIWPSKPEMALHLDYRLIISCFGGRVIFYGINADFSKPFGFACKMYGHLNYRVHQN